MKWPNRRWGFTGLQPANWACRSGRYLFIGENLVGRRRDYGGNARSPETMRPAAIWFKSRFRALERSRSAAGPEPQRLRASATHQVRTTSPALAGQRASVHNSATATSSETPDAASTRVDSAHERCSRKARNRAEPTSSAGASIRPAERRVPAPHSVPHRMPPCPFARTPTHDDPPHRYKFSAAAGAGSPPLPGAPVKSIRSLESRRTIVCEAACNPDPSRLPPWEDNGSAERSLSDLHRPRQIISSAR
jgi:hypothetical protein